ncbi:UNVERIFIED_CONTAM: hypothetical protein HDU68_006219 [Siphonaria sp. JEL0065]|nr:hypothetical protein HDU68_006219 [Siphonaria sp. JEL0065]
MEQNDVVIEIKDSTIQENLTPTSSPLQRHTPNRKSLAEIKSVLKKNGGGSRSLQNLGSPASPTPSLLVVPKTPQILTPTEEKPRKRSMAELKAVLKKAVDTGTIFQESELTNRNTLENSQTEQMQSSQQFNTQNSRKASYDTKGILSKGTKLNPNPSMPTSKSKTYDLTEILRKAIESKTIFQAVENDEGSNVDNPRLVSVNSHVEYAQSKSPSKDFKERDARPSFEEKLKVDSGKIQSRKQSLSISIEENPEKQYYEEDEEEDVPIDDKFAKRLNVPGSGKDKLAYGFPGSPNTKGRPVSNLQSIHARSKSLASNTSMTNGLTKELTETWSVIIKKMKFTLLAVILNAVLLGLLRTAGDKGVVLNIQAHFINQFGGIMLLLILLICNIVTIWSLNDAGSCIFGFLLSSKRGFSFAVCGYMHTTALAKMSFAQSLSLTSKYRKVLSRASFLWIMMEFMKVLTPIGAISLAAQKYALYNDMSDCIYFTQDSRLKPIDRKWPNLDYESGVAEYVFGSSLGKMRSEVPGVNITTAMYPPSLISTVNNGDLILGLGFTVDISTTCKCAKNLSSAGLVAAGVDQSHVGQVIQEYVGMNRMPGITFGIITKNSSLMISNVFSGYSLCGGNSASKSIPLVCSTSMSNHQVAELEISFMTDGTTASIAPNVVQLVATRGSADVKTWLSFAMTSLINGPVSSYLTPPTVPGSLAPLLWWTSPNLIAIDRAIVESGVETMYAILFKAAIQRTYTAQGTQCLRKNIIASFQSLVTILPSGYTTLVVLLVIQMVVSILSLLTFGVWLLAPFPIGPAVRATQEPIYLITLLQSSCNIGIGLNDLCNAETYAIWQKLDAQCRIGESVATKEEDIGKIVMDKPSLDREAERILALETKAANPLEVLELDHKPWLLGKDIKVTYRKKSLLLHPDKCKHPRAQDAFEMLKKAEGELMEEGKRKWLLDLVGVYFGSTPPYPAFFSTCTEARVAVFKRKNLIKPNATSVQLIQIPDKEKSPQEFNLLLAAVKVETIIGGSESA